MSNQITQKMTTKKINLLEVPRDEQGVFASLLRLSGSGIEGLESALNHIQPTLVADALISQLKNNPDLANVQDLDEIIGSLVNLAGTAYSVGATVEETVDAVIASIRNDDVVELSDEATEELRGSLKRLERTRSLELIAKGSQLIKAGERTFLSAKVYSDLRPIFVGEETQVAGGVIIHQFAVRSMRDGRREHTYFTLDSTDLDELQEVISRAVKKDKALRELAACSSTPILSPPIERGTTNVDVSH